MADVHQQPEQSNYLAEGQTLTCKLTTGTQNYSQSDWSFLFLPSLLWGCIQFSRDKLKIPIVLPQSFLFFPSLFWGFWYLLAICTLISLSVLWGMWAGFACEHILSRWNPPSGAVEMATDKCSCAALQNEVHGLFHCQDLVVCSLRKSTHSFSSLSANPFLWRPLIFHMPCLVRLSLIFCLNGSFSFESSYYEHVVP